MPTRIPKTKLRAAINQIVSYSYKVAAMEEPNEPRLKHLQNFREFLISEKVDEVIDKLVAECTTTELFVDHLVRDVDTTEPQLLLEYEQYKQIPKTNKWYRFDSGDTNTKTQDHVHVYQGKNKQLYAINQDGTPHDGSKAQLGKKEMRFLTSLGFTPPADGILEWITLDAQKNYVGFDIELLLG
ncbi:MAG: hypothetical protein IPM68_09375 [Flavobacteriales bacterium]|nr:hypothetical protein [Flavobacteriales bacterium]